jgi:predicted polyphosphate/ATP-dependent NAD kinase
LPVLGIPSGVKMQSGVFALLPESAAAVIDLLLRAGLVDVRLQEVRDIDEAAYRRGEVRSRCFGELLVPEAGHFVQATKQGGMEVEALVLDDIAAEVASRMDAETLYLIGPGTTPRALMESLGLPNTLLGIDAIRAGRVVAADLSGPQLEHLLAQEAGAVVAILTATGGQGSLLGRGNQQLTPAVLRRIGREHIWIIATKSKMQALAGRPLLIDTNDPDLDRQFTGFYRVITGYRDEIFYPASGVSDLPAGFC